jgi:hypothetical protein
LVNVREDQADQQTEEEQALAGAPNWKIRFSKIDWADFDGVCSFN